jgi:hypothetical protein
MSSGSAEVYLRTDRPQAAGTSCATTPFIKTGYRLAGAEVATFSMSEVAASLMRLAVSFG